MNTRKTFFSFIFCLCSLFSFAQTNLVPNPSFEQVDICPSSISQINRATSWFQPNTCCGPGGSSDFYHSCATNPIVGVPSNMIGNQNARTGNGYAGIITYDSFISDYREYLEIKIINSLVAGKKYCVEFYISRADSTHHATNKIGVYFSTDSIVNNNSFF